MQRSIVAHPIEMEATVPCRLVILHAPMPRFANRLQDLELALETGRGQHIPALALLALRRSRKDGVGVNALSLILKVAQALVTSELRMLVCGLSYSAVKFLLFYLEF